MAFPNHVSHDDVKVATEGLRRYFLNEDFLAQENINFQPGKLTEY